MLVRLFWCSVIAGAAALMAAPADAGHVRVRFGYSSGSSCAPSRTYYRYERPRYHTTYARTYEARHCRPPTRVYHRSSYRSSRCEPRRVVVYQRPSCEPRRSYRSSYHSSGYRSSRTYYRSSRSYNSGYVRSSHRTYIQPRCDDRSRVRVRVHFDD